MVLVPVPGLGQDHVGGRIGVPGVDNDPGGNSIIMVGLKPDMESLPGGGPPGLRHPHGLTSGLNILQQKEMIRDWKMGVLSRKYLK